MSLKYCSIILTLLLLLDYSAFGQGVFEAEKQDSIQSTIERLKETRVKSQKSEIELTIQNIDISHFPIIKVIVEAYNNFGDPIDTLYADKLTVLENGVEKKVNSVEKISINERVPVDFVFIVDQTGSMQKYIDAVRSNIYRFTRSLMSRGIDFRIGLVLFSDKIEDVYEQTQDVGSFKKWLRKVEAEGGKDEKENALEAIEIATKMQFRPVANKVCVLISDAPYHQLGENGIGTTDQNTESIIKLLQEKNIRLFTIVPPGLRQYKIMSRSTRGKLFDIGYPFSTILDLFSNQLTNLYALKYDSEQKVIPDSIDIALLNPQKEELVKKTISILDVGRPFIIENLLYKTNSADLPDKVRELDLITEVMQRHQNIVIMIEGHTDSRGSERANLRLSQLRAESVKRYLINKGISAHRMKTKGFGESRPIGDNNTKFGQKLNRRTEVIIVSK